VVVNFLNRSNAADVRVYQLLAEKFRLFDGVFGASDEVLGAIESGVDFEKRIVNIYQQCRTPEQISLEFDKLQDELESEITEAKALAQEQLLNNFDQEVIEKVRIAANDSLNRFEDQLWRTTRYFLTPYAHFEDGRHGFTLKKNPFPGETIHSGPYHMGRNVEDANTYRVGHPLAQRILRQCLKLETPPVELRFGLTHSGKRVAILEPHLGQAGWLACAKFSVESFEVEDRILLAGVSDDGQLLDAAVCRRLFDLPARCGQPVLAMPVPALDDLIEMQQQQALEEIGLRNVKWLDVEVAKLDRWSEDLKFGLEQEIKDLDKEIRETKRAASASVALAEKLTHQRTLKALQSARNQKRKDLFVAQDEIENRRDTVIADIEARISENQALSPLFTIRWSLE